MKSDYCILSADAARARFFGLDSATRSTGTTVTRLVEVQELIHPDRRVRASEKFSDSRPGSRHGGGTDGQDHGVDDHRNANVEEADRRFAQTVLAEVHEKVSSMQAGYLIVTASPRMLTRLRDGLPNKDIDVSVVGNDFKSLSPSQLRERLVAVGVIPETA